MKATDYIFLEDYTAKGMSVPSDSTAPQQVNVTFKKGYGIWGSPIPNSDNIMAQFEAFDPIAGVTKNDGTPYIGQVEFPVPARIVQKRSWWSKIPFFGQILIIVLGIGIIGWILIVTNVIKIPKSNG